MSKKLKTKIDFYFIIAEIIRNKDNEQFLKKLHDEYKQGLFQIV